MSEKITAIILSGGLGRRFDLREKGLISVAGKPLIQHVIDRLTSEVDQVVISCNRYSEAYAGLGYAVVQDGNPDFLGPLAGAIAAQPLVQHPWCLLCANDTPLLPRGLINRLLETAKRNDCQVAYPVCGTRHHFLPCLVETKTLASIRPYLDGGGRSMHGWFAGLATCSIDCAEETSAFININSQRELDQLDPIQLGNE